MRQLASKCYNKICKKFLIGTIFQGKKCHIKTNTQNLKNNEKLNHPKDEFRAKTTKVRYYKYLLTDLFKF